MITPGIARRIAAAAAADKHDDGAELPTYTVAQLPAASAANDGQLVRCSNGAAGQPCLALSDGANWLRVTLGAAVATA